MNAAGEIKRVRVAVAGCGEFGRNHARVYREIESAELVGVFDTDATRAAAFAQEFNTSAFSSLTEMQGQVDAATVAVPTVAHAEVGCALMQLGIDVLVEKPMAKDLADADTLLAAAKKHARIPR
jgi:predicted dehydrogenase